MTDDVSRRGFIRAGLVGLGGIGAGLLLAEHIMPTEACGDEAAPKIVADKPSGWPKVGKPSAFTPTEKNILGPYHRAGAPYRAKITPPLAEGVVLLVCGMVWGHDTKKPIPGATLDIWQANHHGRYDNDDPKSKPEKGIYRYRARMITDAHGYYEYETIHPGRYKLSARTWRPAHIHYQVSAPGYKRLTTQLYFEGDKYNKSDSFIRKSLIIGVENRKVGKSHYEHGVFHVVLAKK